MKTWNVMLHVVDVIDANTAAEAKQWLERKLREAGFETVEFDDDEPVQPLD